MVQPVEALIVHLEHLEAGPGHLERDRAVVANLGEVANTPEQPVGDAGRATRAPGDLGGRLSVDRRPPRMPADRTTILARSSAE